MVESSGPDMELFVRLGYLLTILGVGVLVRHVGVLDTPRRKRVNTVAFYVLLPALIFESTYAEPLSELVSPALVIGLWVVLFGTVGIALLVHTHIDGADRRSVAIVQSYHSNFGYLGVPIVAAALGSAAAAKASVILGIGALTQIPLTIIFLTAINDADVSLVDECRAVGTNPVIVALVAGLVASAIGIEVPSLPVRGLELLGAGALPVALILVGSALEPHLPRGGYATLGSVVALKVFAMPALAFIAFTALGATPLSRDVGVAMFATPAAVSTFVYAGELGGDEQFASLGVFVSTVVSLVWLAVLLHVA